MSSQLLSSAILTVAMVLPVGMAPASDFPPKTMYGTFEIDRWGQGRFPPFVNFVDEKIFPKLREHIGVSVMLRSPQLKQEWIPAPYCLVGFGSIEPYAQPVAIRLRWLANGKPIDAPLSRLLPSEERTFEVHVSNESGDALRLGSRVLMLCKVMRHPPGAQYNAMRQIYGASPQTGQRRLLRYYSENPQLVPKDMRMEDGFRIEAVEDREVPRLVTLKRDATYAWRVTIARWPANEYQLIVVYSAANDSYACSNALSLDVISDEPRPDDVIEMRVRLRENATFNERDRVPLEVVVRNKLTQEIRFPLKGTTDNLELSDFLFCYGIDGRLLPFTSKVAGPAEIRISPEGILNMPVDAPTGTVVARAVFQNGRYSVPLKGDDDPKRFTHGWHWSGHWVAPRLQQSLEKQRLTD